MSARSAAPDKFLRIDKVLELVPVSKSALQKKIKAGEFPKPYALGAMLRAWKLSEIEAWMNARPQDVVYVQGQEAAKAAHRRRKAA
jgi:predicted DNA-binding transcriptional regulator AlpA